MNSILLRNISNFLTEHPIDLILYGFLARMAEIRTGGLFLL